MHKGFDTLDTVHHKLLSIRIPRPEKVHVLDLATIAVGADGILTLIKQLSLLQRS